MPRLAHPVRGAALALSLAAAGCRGEPERRAEEAPPPPLPAPAASAVAPPAPSGDASAEPPSSGDLAAARRLARRLFAQATLEPDRRKARDLFLQAAEALPPGGPALYQAGHAAARDGDAAEARRLFDRALAALERSTRQKPVILPPRDFGALGRLGVGARGRLVLAAAGGGALVLDAIGWHPRFDHDARSPAAALSEDGTLVVVASGKRLLSCSLVEAACAAAATPAPLVELALSADGEALAARGEDGSVQLFDAASLAARAALRSDQGKASALALSAAGDRLFVGLAGGAVLRVRADTGAVEGARRGHGARVVALAVDASGRTLVSADERQVRVGAPGDAEGELLVDIDAKDAVESPIEGLALAPDGRTLYVERKVDLDVWSLDKKAQLPAVLEPPTGPRTGVRVAAAPGRLYVGTSNTSLMPWLSRHGELDAFEARKEPAPEAPAPVPGGLRWGGPAPPQIQLLAAGATVAVVDETCAIAAWDLARAVLLGAGNQHTVTFRNCPGARLSPDGKTLFATSGGSSPVAIDVATWSPRNVNGDGDPLKEPLPPGAPKEAVTATQAAATLAWVDAGDRVHVGPPGGPYRVLGKRYRRPPSPPDVSEFDRDPEPALAVSPKGALVAFRAAADRAEIWEAAGARPAQVILHAGISGIAFGPDETAFVSALDGTLTMARAGAARTLVAPGGGALFALAAVRDGRLLAGAVPADKPTLHLWSTQDGALRATLRVLSQGAMASAPDGTAELFGPVENELDCRFGPFVFGLELCREQLIKKGLLARALDGERTGP